jgi:TrmH family RNA methyltransferase
MKTITSRHNPLVKRIREAIREHDDEIVLEGPKQVADAIAGGWKPIALLHRGVELGESVFDSLSETRQPQGVIGLFERPRSSASEILSRRDTVAVALDGVQDPGNVGTIVRLAAAFDAAGILLLPGCANPYAPKAIRSSAGAILNVRIAPTTEQELLACGLPLIATAMHGAPVDPPPAAAILIFGHEGTGVSTGLLAQATTLAIPMSPRVESLNVAASAAILLARSYALRTAIS